MFCAVFGPNPAMPSSRPAWIASASASTDDTPSSRESVTAFFGPSPGMSMSDRAPGGIFLRSSSSATICPVSKYSEILAAMDLPTLGIFPRPAESNLDTSAW
jgi:hypothetical protein